MTWWSKRLTPAIIGVIAAACGSSFGNPIGWFWAIGFAVFGGAVWWVCIWDLLDEVWLQGDQLILRNEDREDRVPLEQIHRIKVLWLNNPPRVTLVLRSPCEFGARPSFCPPNSPFRFTDPPSILVLRDRLQMIQARQSHETD
jgi:hypothetical protein